MHVEKWENLREKVFICEQGAARLEVGEARDGGGGGTRRAAHSLISHEVDLSAAERNPRELIASNE